MTGWPTVAFVGLGHMGQPMARRLLGSGVPVRGFDVAAAARDAWAAAGGTAFGSAADAAAGADVVILMLPDSGVVEAVIDSGGFLDAVRPGATVVDMSSSEPERTRTLAERLAARQIRLVDAPVSGGVARAETGELAIMVGGSDADVAPVLGLLELMGRAFRAGPVGAGHAVKALNNLMSATHLLITAEAMLAGERFGIDAEAMLAIVNASSGRSGSTQNKWPNFVLPGTFDSGFALRLMLKDMRIAAGLAASLQSPCGLGERAVQVWAKAAAELSPTADHTEIARWLREAATRTTEIGT
ncbi:MAG TPA: NAD(P)-dependent oxidoreductase [Nakamurella sp.]|nr:NAD(P)-dependent oxidoreductase [Nakamurella sp.]